MLDEIGADPSALVVTGRPTTTKTRVLARSQQVVRFDEEDDRDLDPDEAARVSARTSAGRWTRGPRRSCSRTTTRACSYAA
jgi:bifunctional ADP-heptose synthase (sugar kinase/adenylyltransferase)